MHEALEPTQDPGWVLSHEGYNVLSESAVESRLAFGNGFLGMRAARSVSRGPTWVAWLGYSTFNIISGRQGICHTVLRRRAHRGCDT